MKMRGAAIVPFALASRQRERFARVAADVANRGDAAGEPDLELVVDRLRRCRRARPAGARAR